MSQTHIIRKHVLEVELIGSEWVGIGLQSRLSSMYVNKLNDALQVVFDAHIPDDVHVSIDRLELDLGAMSLDNLEDDLGLAIADAVRRVLRERTPDALAQHRPTQSLPASDYVVRSQGEVLVDAFRTFLTSGQLPWSFQVPSHTTLERMIVDFLEQEPLWWPRFADSVRETLAVAMPSRLRLIWQFTEAFQSHVLEWLSKPVHASLMSVLSTLRGDERNAPGVPPDFKTTLWLAALAKVGSPQLLSEASLVAAAIGMMVANPTVLIESGIEHVVKRNWPKALIEFKGLRPRGIIDNVPESRLLTQKKLINASLVDLDGLYVHNAGAILLHPFIPMFFERLGVAENARIVTPSGAVALLHYLVTGNASAPEHELTICKILCGLPTDAPVEYVTEISEEQRDESIALLESIIRHWDVLRSTSPDGLRESFLQRPGKLSITDDGKWLIQVEPRTYDILLDSLPWGIAMIQLPWMASMCRVEWNA